MTPEPPPNRNNDNPWRQLGIATGLIFTIPAGVILGGWLGYWLDGKLGTSPVLMLVLGAVGFAGSVMEVLRQIRKIR